VHLRFHPLRVKASQKHPDAGSARADLDDRIARLQSRLGSELVIETESTPRWTEIVLAGRGTRLRLRISDAEWTLNAQIDARVAESLVGLLEDVFPELHDLRDRPGPGAQPWRA
jgi:hypothetical protein